MCVYLKSVCFFVLVLQVGCKQMDGTFLSFQFQSLKNPRLEEGVEALLKVASALRTLKTSYGISHARVKGSEALTWKTTQIT